MGTANHRDRSRRLRDADRTGVLRFRRSPAHFLLETVGEDVIRTIPRFFYKYRGVEKIAEGQPADRVLLLAERFSGTARLRSWPGVLSGRRGDLRDRGAAARAGACVPCLPNWSGCAITRRRSPASATRRRWRSRPARPHSSKRTCFG